MVWMFELFVVIKCIFLIDEYVWVINDPTGSGVVI